MIRPEPWKRCSSLEKSSVQHIHLAGLTQYATTISWVSCRALLGASRLSARNHRTENKSSQKGYSTVSVQNSNPQRLPPMAKSKKTKRAAQTPSQKKQPVRGASDPGPGNVCSGVEPNAPQKTRYSRKDAARTQKARATELSGPVVLREDSCVAPRTHPRKNWTSLDLFCGAGGITEGFRRAGFECLYANDINEWAIKTFRANHATTLADNRPIEEVDARKLRKELGIDKGELDILVGGPPCQGFSINAPERFLDDPRNSLFRHYVRFIDEFEPKSLLVEKRPVRYSVSLE